jgi:hypothetical protein
MSKDWKDLTEEERVERMVQMKLHEENKAPLKKWTAFLSGFIITVFTGGLTLLLFYGIVLILKLILGSLGVIKEP